MSMQLLSAYFKLTKPRLTAMVIISSVAGYFMAGHYTATYSRLFYLILGAALSCSGSAVLNQYLERNLDAKMSHTKGRPIPSGMVHPVAALNFGIILILTGIIELYLTINLLTAFLSLLTAFIYIIIYTPMKRISWLSTSLGAVSGALPPIAGWTAASGSIGTGAWILFIILFVWQHPHFYSIAWMHRKDYKRAGFKILSVIDPEGKRTFRHVFFYSLILVPISLLPCFFGLSSAWYGAGAFILGAVPLALSLSLLFSRSDDDTQKLFKASVSYLPMLFALIVLDSALF